MAWSCAAGSGSARRHYRYAVTVGGQEYFVDDERRFATNEPVGICLPAQALHLYPAGGTGGVDWRKDGRPRRPAADRGGLR